MAAEVEDRISVRPARSVDPRGSDHPFWIVAVSDGDQLVVVTAWIATADHARIEGDPEEWVAGWMERRVRSLPRNGKRLRTLELHSPLQMRP